MSERQFLLITHYSLLITGLLIDPAGEKAAVHGDDFSRHKAGRVGGEEDRDAGQLLDVSEATHGRAQEELAAPLGLVQKPVVERGAEDARRNRVDADAVLRPLDRERLWQRGYRGLARRVRRDFVERDEA